jgi:hypothetical protein
MKRLEQRKGSLFLPWADSRIDPVILACFRRSVSWFSFGRLVSPV